MKTHTLNLTNGAVEALKSALASPGWYEDTVTAYRAGQILEMPEFDIAAPKEDGAAEPWRSVAVHLELTERQRETAKKCVEHYLKKGAFAINRSSMTMIRELGLAPED